MLLGAIAAVPACDSNDDDNNNGSGGAAGEAGSDGKGGTGGSAGSSAGKGGSAGSAGKGGTGGTGGSGVGGEAGDNGTAGTPDQGGAGGEPATTGGAAGSSAGEGGSGGSGEPELALLKFCNNVGLEGEDGDVEFTLVVGTGDNQVTLEALTGTCAPAVGAACSTLEAGDSVPFEILDHEGDPYFAGSFDAAAGEQLVFFAEFDETAEETSAEITVLDSDECSEVDYADFYDE